MRNLRNALKHPALKKGFDLASQGLPPFQGPIFNKWLFSGYRYGSSFEGCEISSKISNYVMMKNIEKPCTR